PPRRSRRLRETSCRRRSRPRLPCYFSPGQFPRRHGIWSRSFGRELCLRHRAESSGAGREPEQELRLRSRTTIEFAALSSFPKLSPKRLPRSLQSGLVNLVVAPNNRLDFTAGP